MKSEAQKTAWLAHTSIRHQYQQTTASSKMLDMARDIANENGYEASINDERKTKMVINHLAENNTAWE